MTSTLTRVTIDPYNPRIQRMQRNIETLHAIIAAATEGSKRPLWRMDGDRIYIVADQVDEDRLSARLAGAAVRSLDYERFLSKLDNGMTIRFHWAGNTATGIGRKPIHDPTARISWATGKLGNAGLDVASCVEQGNRTLDFRKAPKTQRVRLQRTDFAGTATVADIQTLREAMTGGIGRGRAYGLGLLLIG